MSIGNNIRNIRKRNGMTLKQIADIIECSPQLISQYESGKRPPKLETKKKIAAALNCDVSDIDKSIYVISTEYELTPERLEHFKNDAEVLEIIKKKSSSEDYTEEEQQKILEYKKRMAESKEVVREKREQPDIDSDKTYIDPLAYENSYSFASSEEEYETFLRQRQKQGEDFLLSDYRKLNESGQAEARKRVNELTEVPRYINPDTPPQD